MAKKAKVEKDRSERWLLTYSDLMNLLLILFIIFYAISKIDSAKATQVAESMRKAFNGTSTSSTASAAANASPYWNKKDEYSKLYDDLLKLIQKNNLQSKVDIKTDDRGIVISLKDNVLFTPGSAEINGDSYNLIVNIGNLLEQVKYTQIIVEGHTDSDPIHSGKYKDNRDLSSDRANNVTRILQDVCKLTPGKMSSLGYGEYRPVAPNDTAANKAKNRRVVITLLRKSIDPYAVVGAGSLISYTSSQTAAETSAAAQNIASSKAAAQNASKTTTSQNASSSK